MTLKQLASSTAFLVRINLVVAYLLDARLALLLLRWISFGLVCFVVAARNLRNSLVWITLLNALAVLLHVLGDPPASPSSYLVLDFVGSMHRYSLWKLVAVDVVIAGLQTLAAFATHLDQIPGYRARWGDDNAAPSRHARRRAPLSNSATQRPDGPRDTTDDGNVLVDQQGNWDHSDHDDYDDWDHGSDGGDQWIMDVTLGDLKRAWKGEPPRNDADFNPA